MVHEEECPYVSRGGLKLAHALHEFDIDVDGFVCADLGCSTGGFTDCLLQHGAASVTAVDTGYNVLDYKLRVDSRVTVRERENALHVVPGEIDGCDLVVLDMGWTKQGKALPAASRWLTEAGRGRIITLIKPHYEADLETLEKHGVKGVLPVGIAQEICDGVVETLPAIGFAILGVTRSPITGSKGKRTGNTEWLALLGVSG